MHKLSTSGIPLPEVYVCSTTREAEPLIKAGIPYIITELDDLDIVKVILYSTLKRKFPRIKWTKVLGISESMVWRLNIHVPGGYNEVEKHGEEGPTNEVHSLSDIATEERVFSGESDAPGRIMDVDDFFADSAGRVNIEQLQALKLLPRFMDDAADAIRMNLEDRMRWHECYNKKLSACVGDYGYSAEAGNLIILDISGSIPEGISATMIHLIQTLVSQTDADLIITASRSKYYPNGCELPTPTEIRGQFGYANESMEFIRIMKRLQGRHYSNVISFGDFDTPDYENFDWVKETIKVDRLLNYHTERENLTGYAKWVKQMNPDCEIVFDTDWCEVMIR